MCWSWLELWTHIAWWDAFYSSFARELLSPVTIGRFEDLGITFTGQDQLNEVFIRFKALADKKHEIFDEDLQRLVSEVADKIEDTYSLVSLEVCSKTGQTPQAQIKLGVGAEEKTATAEGSGPVDAAYKAIEKIASSDTDLLLYSVNAITKGTESQGEVTVRLERRGQIVNGVGSDTDIVSASVKAYLNALNLLEYGGLRSHPQHAV